MTYILCGLTGFLSGRKDEPVAPQDLRAMVDTLHHRGPDAQGIWLEPEDGIALGHARLSIVDLSSAGAQPMQSRCGRYAIVFNGEIYNHLELRVELEQAYGTHLWRGYSDTESLIACISAWGLKTTLQKSIGMFALALWDKQTKQLSLARDRFGEKPLYYGWQDGVFFFGSELKAFKKHPRFSPEINKNVLPLYLRYSYVPTPYSIYHQIYKLRPGNIAVVSLRQPDPELVPYWSAYAVANRGLLERFSGNTDEACYILEEKLKTAVSSQMIADVPLGAFLSGGIDSSSIVALMQAGSSRPIKTFTIGYEFDGYSEAESAKEVASYLGTDHTELYVSASVAQEVIPKLPQYYDEPFADSSQIPTYLVANLAKRKVTVALSGDAGDELFAGYNRYQFTEYLWQKIALLPKGFRKQAARLMRSLSPATWDRIAAVTPRGSKYALFGDKLHKGAGVFASPNIEALYLGLVSQCLNPESLVVNAGEPAIDQLDWSNHRNFNSIESMMLTDATSYLLDDILTKVDRAAMSVSLETRIPFLDHRLFEFAWTLPLDYKLRAGVTKWPLRQILYKHVPQKLVERPKMGFGIPLHDWLRGPLRDWAESLLDERRLSQEGFFHMARIRDIWLEHLSGKRNHSGLIWNVLMFQSWYEETY